MNITIRIERLDDHKSTEKVVKQAFAKTKFRIIFWMS
jgi:hypothetical protein